MGESIVIATWPFGETAVRAALAELARQRSVLEAAVAGAQAVEDDPTVNSVGYGGLPNALGIVQLDACVMEGTTLNCGSVAGLENVRHAAAVALRVMQRTPHVMLVGEGARQFAQGEGFRLENLLSPAALAEWQRRKAAIASEPGNSRRRRAARKEELSHDTVAVLAGDRRGKLAGACSTSGLALKMPGRVGDSPLIGAGLYVDDAAGAAAGTGVGEEIIRIGGSLLAVEEMRSGRTPQAACEAVIARVIAAAKRRGVPPARVALIALDPAGRVGAACTGDTDFPYAVGRKDRIELFTATPV